MGTPPATAHAVAHAGGTSLTDPGAQGPGVQDPGAADLDVEVVGARVEALLEVVADAEPAARTAAEDLVRELLGLYGAALERLVGLLERVAPEAVRDLGDDPLLAGLLVLHDLHPQDTAERVAAAVAAFPDVTVASVSGDVVRVEVAGGCGCCATAALPPGVEGAVRAAAPEVARVEVAEAAPRNGLIPSSALLTRPHGNAR